MKWYYSDAGQQGGPIEEADFQELVRKGIVRDDTPVWREGMAAWAPYGTVKPAPAPLPAPPAPRPAPPQPAQAYVPPAAPMPQTFHPAAFVPPAAANASASSGTESSGLFFFYPVLKALNDGRFVRRVVIIALQVVAVLTALGGVLLLLAALGLSGGGTGAGAILAGVFTLLGALCAAQVFWYRSGSVRNLEDSQFTVIPVVSILFRLGGEVALTMGLASSIGGFLAVLVGGGGGATGMPSVGQLIPGLGGGGGVIGALVMLIAGSVASFFMLVFFYFLAESTVVAVDIAQHIRTLVRLGEAKR